MSRNRLLLDVMLGKLATYLRMCGYDTAYALDRGVEDDDRLCKIAIEEDRSLLTRDRELASSINHGILIESRDITEQLSELADAGFELSLADPPVRCSRCNGLLELVEEPSLTPAYAPDPDTQSVWRCRACGQFFWKGSHWDDVADTLGQL